jgi:hypothetical protein
MGPMKKHINLSSDFSDLCGGEHYEGLSLSFCPVLPRVYEELWEGTSQ